MHFHRIKWLFSSLDLKAHKMRVLNLNIVAYFLNLKKNIDVLLVDLAGLVLDKFFTYSNLSP